MHFIITTWTNCPHGCTAGFFFLLLTFLICPRLQDGSPKHSFHLPAQAPMSNLRTHCGARVEEFAHPWSDWWRCPQWAFLINLLNLFSLCATSDVFFYVWIYLHAVHFHRRNQDQIVLFDINVQIDQNSNLKIKHCPFLNSNSQRGL